MNIILFSQQWKFKTNFCQIKIYNSLKILLQNYTDDTQLFISDLLIIIFQGILLKNYHRDILFLANIVKKLRNYKNICL